MSQHSVSVMEKEWLRCVNFTIMEGLGEDNEVLISKSQWGMKEKGLEVLIDFSYHGWAKT